jgi:hypothetical protein
MRQSSVMAFATLALTLALSAPPVSAQSADFAVYPVPPDFPMYETEQLRQSCLSHGLLEHCGGEPSIGVNPFTNSAMLQMMLTTARIRWDDSQDPPAATWTAVSYTGFVRTADPVLITDRATGRTFNGQTNPDFPFEGITGIVSTDDDAASWNERSQVVSPNPDKPVLGSGNYHAPAPAGASYPSAIYHCVADAVHFESANAYCSRSDDGGQTWGAATVAVPGQGPCLPYAGEVEVDGDGVVYLPLEHCGSFQGVAISDDNGDTWQVSTVPGIRDSDQNFDQFPDVASDQGGRVYYAASSQGRPVVATSDDHAEHWTTPVDVAAGAGIEYAEFPTVVAGDDGRAAMAFLGSTTRGYPENQNYDGIWHLYVSVTTDGGATWETTDVTGDDPVQRGCIGAKLTGSCKRRNLLDFMDSAVDAEGRVLVAYPDGCVSETCVGPSGTPEDSNDSSYGVARQVAGSRMFAAFDSH